AASPTRRARARRRACACRRAAASPIRRARARRRACACRRACARARRGCARRARTAIDRTRRTCLVKAADAVAAMVAFDAIGELTAIGRAISALVATARSKSGHKEHRQAHGNGTEAGYDAPFDHRLAARAGRALVPGALVHTGAAGAWCRRSLQKSLL